MTAKRHQSPKLFTVEEANKTLPLVRAITKDLVELSNEVMERRERLDHLRQDRDPDADDVYSQELREIERELEQDASRLQDYVQELRDLGVEPKSASEGLVDFPAMFDDRFVYLCWQLGEPEVLYWHDLDAGYAGRQPVAAISVQDD